MVFELDTAALGIFLKVAFFAHAGHAELPSSFILNEDYWQDYLFLLQWVQWCFVNTARRGGVSLKANKHRSLIVVLLGFFVITTGAAAADAVEDSAGRLIEFEAPLERVVVLTTPAAELIRAIGGTDRITGVSQTIAGNCVLLDSCLIRLTRPIHSSPFWMISSEKRTC